MLHKAISSKIHILVYVYFENVSKLVILLIYSLKNYCKHFWNKNDKLDVYVSKNEPFFVLTEVFFIKIFSSMLFKLQVVF